MYPELPTELSPRVSLMPAPTFASCEPWLNWEVRRLRLELEELERAALEKRAAMEEQMQDRMREDTTVSKLCFCSDPTSLLSLQRTDAQWRQQS